MINYQCKSELITCTKPKGHSECKPMAKQLIFLINWTKKCIKNPYGDQHQITNIVETCYSTVYSYNGKKTKLNLSMHLFNGLT